LQEANKAFRDAVASEMQEAARQAGVEIRTDNFVAIPFDDSSMVFVNAMIEGADRVSIEQLAEGADVRMFSLSIQARSWDMPERK
jgi:hypothetical protein